MADIEIIGGRSGTLRSLLFQVLQTERKEQDARQVLFVPEQYTLQAERDLITGMHLPGLLNLDVISPTKLKTLVREYAGFSGRRPLDETGRAMAIHRALHDCEEKLTYYRGVGALYGAVPRMEQTLMDMRDSGLTSKQLESIAGDGRDGARRARMRDLARIWQAYDALTADRFDDPAAAWTDTCSRLPASGLWNGVSLYIYGFDMIRPDLRELILSAAEVCGRITVLMTMTGENAPDGRIFRVQRESAMELTGTLRKAGWKCTMRYPDDRREGLPEVLRFLEENLFSDQPAAWEEDPAENISLFAAANPTAEAWNAVSTLMAWHEKGMPWKRMAVVLNGESAVNSTLTAALRRNGVPFFCSQKDRASRHGVSRLLCAALDCVSGGYRTESVLQAALSGFGSLSREEGTALESYALANGIELGRWNTPFTRGEGAEEAEELRLRLLGPIEHLHSALRGAENAEASVTAVADFLGEEKIFEQLKERQERLTANEMYAEAVVDRQVWDLLMRILDQLHALLSGRQAALREMTRFITGALDRSMIASLPEDEEGVSVGEVGHMLAGSTDLLILMGMNDGVMDIPDNGLLTDAERDFLAQAAGRRVGLDRSRMVLLKKSDYYRTLTLPARMLRLSFSLRGEDGRPRMPGEPVLELRRLFPLLQEDGGIRADGIPDRPRTPWMAVKGLGSRLREMRDGVREDLDRDWKNALRALWDRQEEGPTIREIAERLLPRKEDGHIRRETAVPLFQADRVSISRLECYAGCPYRHFVQYGLRPMTQAAWEFTSNEAGNFFHAAMEKYINRAVRERDWPSLDQERTDALMDEVLRQLTEEWRDGPLSGDAGGIWQGEEYIRRARHAASVLTRFAANSDFRVVGTEIPFGTEEGMPPLILTLSDGTRVALQGKIDRLDAWDAPEGRYLRVMDLKSSAKELDPGKMDRGEQLQLMIYLRAASRAVPGGLAAGAMYFPMLDADVDAGTPEEAEKKRLAEVRLRGVALAEEPVIRAMDRDVSPYSVGKVFNQDGTVSRSAPWALEARVLSELMDAAAERAAELCAQIRDGAIPVAPSGEPDGYSACSWCEYLPICRKRRGDERPPEPGLSFRDVAEKNALRKREK